MALGVESFFDAHNDSTLEREEETSASARGEGCLSGGGSGRKLREARGAEHARALTENLSLSLAIDAAATPTPRSSHSDRAIGSTARGSALGRGWNESLLPRRLAVWLHF